MQGGTVADQEMLGLVDAKTTRRPQAKPDVDAGAPGARRVHGGRADGLGDDQHPRRGPPQGDLPPETDVDHRDHLERRARQHCRHPQVGHAQACRQRRAVTAVTVEELYHRGRPAERQSALQRHRIVGGGDQPHPPPVDQRVRRPGDGFVRHPGEPDRALIDRPGEPDRALGERHDLDFERKRLTAARDRLGAGADTRVAARAHHLDLKAAALTNVDLAGLHLMTVSHGVSLLSWRRSRTSPESGARLLVLISQQRELPNTEGDKIDGDQPQRG